MTTQSTTTSEVKECMNECPGCCWEFRQIPTPEIPAPIGPLRPSKVSAQPEKRPSNPFATPSNSASPSPKSSHTPSFIPVPIPIPLNIPNLQPVSLPIAPPNPGPNPRPTSRSGTPVYQTQYHGNPMNDGTSEARFFTVPQPTEPGMPVPPSSMAPPLSSMPVMLPIPQVVPQPILQQYPSPRLPSAASSIRQIQQDQAHATATEKAELVSRFVEQQKVFQKRSFSGSSSSESASSEASRKPKVITMKNIKIQTEEEQYMLKSQQRAQENIEKKVGHRTKTTTTTSARQTSSKKYGEFHFNSIKEEKMSKSASTQDKDGISIFVTPADASPSPDDVKIHKVVIPLDDLASGMFNQHDSFTRKSRTQHANLFDSLPTSPTLVESQHQHRKFFRSSPSADAISITFISNNGEVIAHRNYQLSSYVAAVLMDIQLDAESMIKDKDFPSLQRLGWLGKVEELQRRRSKKEPVVKLRKRGEFLIPSFRLNKYFTGHDPLQAVLTAELM